MGCVNSVQDKQAAGTWTGGVQGARSGHWQAEAASAVAELLGGGTSAQVEVAVKCRRLPNKDVLRQGTHENAGVALCQECLPAGTGTPRYCEESGVTGFRVVWHQPRQVQHRALQQPTPSCLCHPPLLHGHPASPPRVRSKSDPLAVLLVGDPHGSTWSEVGRTDVVANSLSELLGGGGGGGRRRWRGRPAQAERCTGGAAQLVGVLRSACEGGAPTLGLFL